MTNCTIIGKAFGDSKCYDSHVSTLVELDGGKYPQKVVVNDWRRKADIYKAGDCVEVSGLLSMRTVNKDGKTYHNITLSVN